MIDKWLTGVNIGNNNKIKPVLRNFSSIVFSLYVCTYVQFGNTDGLRRHIASGDIAGRKLIIPGLGWTGHVASQEFNELQRSLK